jgi:DegV family protein with EDD domain
MLAEVDVKIIPMIFRIDENDYLNYPDDRAMSSHDFYNKLRNNKKSTTAQINPSTYIQFLKPFLEEGKDILLAVFSSALSSTFNSASIAVETLKEKFPNRKILIMDSLSAAGGQGYLAYKLGLNQLKGMSLEENFEWGENNKLHIAHWFTIDDLMYLKRGGRLSAGKAWMGTLLTLKPILHVDNKGKLIPIETVRGRKQALIALVNKFEEEATDPKSNLVIISHSDNITDAEFLGKKLLERFDIPKILYTNIGPVIGSHVGANAILLFFTAKKR